VAPASALGRWTVGVVKRGLMQLRRGVQVPGPRSRHTIAATANPGYGRWMAEIKSRYPASLRGCDVGAQIRGGAHRPSLVANVIDPVGYRVSADRSP
jgi:hypothetical protein